MRDKRYYAWLWCIIAFFCASPCEIAAGPPHPQSFRDLCDAIGDLRHLSANCEAELENVKDKLEIQEKVVETLFRDQTEGQRRLQEVMKGKMSSSEQRLAALEVALPLLQGDVQALKGHLEKLTTSLVALQGKLSVCEEHLVQQGQATNHLQSAMQALTAAMQTEASDLAVSNSPTHSVVEGESLGKIAHRHGVSVKALKESNGLTTDKIRVGQVLTIPTTALQN